MHCKSRKIKCDALTAHVNESRATSVPSRLNKLMFLMAAITDIVCARSNIKVDETPPPTLRTGSASKEKSMKADIHKFVKSYAI